jgi:hypothetical protein
MPWNVCSLSSPPPDQASCREGITAFIDKNFNFSGREFLRRTLTHYFLGILEKNNRFLRLWLKSKLMLNDCNGGDIFGNINVCSYNSTFELFRREPGNKDYVAFGGMFEFKDILNIIKPSITKQSFLVPFREFAPDGRCIRDSKEEDRKRNQWLEEQMSKIDSMKESVKKIDQQISESTSREDWNELMKKRNALVESIRKAIEQYNHDIIASLVSIPIDLLPTNDLSSRVRAHSVYLIFAANSNHFVANSTFLQPSAKLKIELERTILPQLDLGSKSSPPKFLAIGISLVHFEKKRPDFQPFDFPEKQFFLRTTMFGKDKHSVLLTLYYIRIVSPFSPIIGKAGFNNHARFVQQY